MGADSKIEWTDHTFNPWRGCSKVSAGCDHCYAETMAKRNPKALGIWGDDGTRVEASPQMWRQVLAWNEEAIRSGIRRRVFCASMADVFEDRDDLVRPRAKLWSVIMGTPGLDWQLLTKRPQNIDRLLRPIVNAGDGMKSAATYLAEGKAPNVWLGVSVEDQERADERIPLLLQAPAAVRFLSIEPLLGPVDLGRWLTLGKWDSSGRPVEFPRLDWVIVGGESGPRARPMDPDWVRSLRDQCVEAGVAFFFKQWGEWIACDQGDCDEHKGPVANLRHDGKLFGATEPQTFCCANCSSIDVTRVGKKAAGRMLDGKEWSEFPRRPDDR